MMMKKYASLLFALFLALSLSVSAAADADVYVYDDADILSTDECAALNEAAAAVSEQYGCGVYVVTVDDMADYIDPDAVTETDETGMAAFTEYAWDALGLAASYDSNGIMLALSMVERDFQMLAHGDTANAAFTDYGKYIMPNTQVTVTAADGTAIIYQPFLSLRDGSLAVPEDGTVYDFTVYPEGFVRETTA